MTINALVWNIPFKQTLEGGVMKGEAR